MAEEGEEDSLSISSHLPFLLSQAAGLNQVVCGRESPRPERSQGYWSRNQSVDGMVEEGENEKISSGV